ncbi:hypothetical protein [Streptomyces sp. ALI-76-A]|nr:hypothetical protein [Streptomyces sp. ALI-76-A]MDL5205490.1 hypothetical protein [Streptomyces sp. ALI-76-A]
MKVILRIAVSAAAVGAALLVSAGVGTTATPPVASTDDIGWPSSVAV